METSDEAPVVRLAGELLDLEELVRYMDPRLAEAAGVEAGPDATPQAIVDRYLELHRARYGEEFVQGTLVSLW